MENRTRKLKNQVGLVEDVDEDSDSDSVKEKVDSAQVSGSIGKSGGVIPKKKQRKLTSKVWDYFEMLAPTPGEKLMCKCIHCGKKYIAESSHGTKNLSRHIASCLRTTTKDVGQLMISHSDGGVTMNASRFDPEKYRELMVRAISMHDLPFSYVEYEGVRDVHSYLCSQVKHFCRKTARSDVLKLYSEEKRKLKNFLSTSKGRISLTSDLWTSINTDGYVCLTAHFIDNDWKLQKRVLNFCLMPPPHTGVAICEKIYNLLVDWKIEHKLFSFTLDNASANDVFVDLLKSQLNLKQALLKKGELFHVHCCAHVLNLIVQDGLKCVDSCVYKIRESIKYIKGSQSRKKKFLESVARVPLNGSEIGLRQDVPTRCNSTFFMLESALYYRRALQNLSYADSNYTHCPTSVEWERAEIISKFLGVFYNATLLFSGTNYPTSNLFFPQISMVQHTLKMGMEDRDSCVSVMATKMYKKFEKYWNQYNVLLAIACILDSRYKIHVVEFFYSKLYGDFSNEFNVVKTRLFSLYNEYASKVEKETSSSSNASTMVEKPLGYAGLYSQDCNDLMKSY